MRYVILGVALGVAVGFFLGRTINDHFDTYVERCYSVLYEAGRQTTTTEVPCP